MKGIIVFIALVLGSLIGLNLYSAGSAKKEIESFVADRFPEINMWKSELSVNLEKLSAEDKKYIRERLNDGEEISKRYIDLLLEKEGFVKIGHGDGLFYVSSGEDVEYLEIYNIGIEYFESIEDCGRDCDHYSDEDFIIEKDLFKVVGHQKCDRFQRPYSCEVLLGQENPIGFNLFTYKKRMIIGELPNQNGVYIFNGKFSPKIGDLVSERRRSSANL